MSRVLAEILELPVADRVRLVQEIWDSVSLAPDSLPVSDGEREFWTADSMRIGEILPASHLGPTSRDASSANREARR